MDNDQNTGLETLEEQGSDRVNSATTAPAPSSPPAPKKPGWYSLALKKAQAFMAHFNIYLLLFIVAIIVALIVTYISYSKNKKATNTNVQTQSLSQQALQSLNNSDISLGDSQQTLGIKSNTVFAGKVLVRDSLEVAGTIKVGNNLNLPGLTAGGTSNFDQIQGNKLALSGDALIQGQVNIQKNLVVSGSASFGGTISAPQLTIQSLQLSGDLQLARHIDAGGNTPSKNDGGALGSGGSTSLSGTDTAGTITINTGGSPVAGCFITVNFAQKFSGTPHVVITPVGSAAASLNYYINRTSTNFSVCSANAAPGNSSFSFDYVAID